jgi:hypothetical protein
VASRSTNYPRELGERAVRMVAQVRPEYLSDWPAICAVAGKLGIGTEELRWYLEDYLLAPFGVWEDRGPRIQGWLIG